MAVITRTIRTFFADMKVKSYIRKVMKEVRSENYLVAYRFILTHSFTDAKHYAHRDLTARLSTIAQYCYKIIFHVRLHNWSKVKYYRQMAGF